MLARHRRSLPVSMVLIGLFSITASAEEKVVVATVRRAADLTATERPKLSPALIAMKDSQGVLKGADERGRPIISLPEENLPMLTASRVVLDVRDAGNWKPVTKLKLSYRSNDKPTNQDLERLGLRLIEDYSKGSFMIVEPFNQIIDAKLANVLVDNPSIRYVTPSVQVQAIPPAPRPPQNEQRPKVKPQGQPNAARQGSPGDALYHRLWGMRNINAPQAWNAINKTPNVVVAVIDTGIDYDHADLKDNIWKNADGSCGVDCVEDDDDPMDENSHGTHCAGTIGAITDPNGVVGVTWQVKIMGCRWLDQNGSGDVLGAIRCIDYAVDNGADILSNSWFWYEDDPDLEDAIKRASDAGRLFVVAAGNFQDPNNNDGDNDKPTTYGRYPSAYQTGNMISVVAIADGDHLAWFTNWGKKTATLGAPGVDVVSSVLRGKGDHLIDPSRNYDSFNGTSMATPHVAGAAALVLEHLRGSNQNAKGIDTKQPLLDHVRKIDALQGRCRTEGALDISFLSQPDSPAKAAR